MNLKQKTFSAGRWTATSAFSRAGFQLLQIAVLARLLSPADFALMAITISTMSVFNLFADMGLSRAIIHFESVSAEELSSLYWLNLLAGLVLSIMFSAVAPLLGHIFKQPRLEMVMLTCSPFFLISATGQQFRALAEKNLRFSTLAVNEITAGALSFVFAVTIAYFGAGVYSLVGGLLVMAATNTIMAWWRLSAGFRPSARPKFSRVRPYLHFSGYLTAETLVNTLVSQADVFIGGSAITPTAFGFYTVPRDLTQRISMVTNPIITRVGFPVMARLQNDLAALKSIYLQTVRMAASINIPAYIALVLFAKDIVDLIYGPKWEPAATYLRILGVWGLINSIGNPVGSLLLAVGQVKREFWWNFSILLILPVLYWFSVNYRGLTGLAWTVMILYLFMLLPGWYFLIRPCCGARLSEYLNQLSTPLLLSLVVDSSAWLLTRGIPHGTLRLAVGGAIGVTLYVALSRLYNRPWFEAMWTLLRLPSGEGGRKS